LEMETGGYTFTAKIYILQSLYSRCRQLLRLVFEDCALAEEVHILSQVLRMAACQYLNLGDQRENDSQSRLLLSKADQM